MNTIDLPAIEQDIKSFIAEREWDQFHSVKNLSMALSIEAGEIMEIFQWMSEADSNLVKDKPELKAKLSDEVADVFVYLLRITSKAEIDLESAVKSKMIRNKEKYPVEKARGNSKKYTEL